VNLRRRIREMVAIMREEDLAEIEVRRWFTTVRVRRPGVDGVMQGRHGANPAESHAAAGQGDDAEAKPPKNLVPIKSPMVAPSTGRPLRTRIPTSRKTARSRSGKRSAWSKR